MKKGNLLILWVAISGCQPLQQAPLAYTSKVAYGLDISSTSTETPGLSMVVGYKAVDAAYVPVAVAKKCDHSPCDISMYEIVPIHGSSDENTSAEEVLKTKTLEEEKAERDLNTIRGSSEVKIAALQEKIETLRAEADELDIEALDYEESKSKKIQEIASNDQEIRKTRDEIKNAEEHFTNAKSAKETARLSPGGNLKSDAYSVYGRFESEADVEAAKMGFGIGKVFSTGVASQHLTTGLGNSYKVIAESRKECYITIQKAITEKLEKTVIDSLTQSCNSIK